MIIDATGWSAWFSGDEGWGPHSDEIVVWQETDDGRVRGMFWHSKARKLMPADVMQNFLYYARDELRWKPIPAQPGFWAAEKTLPDGEWYYSPVVAWCVTPDGFAINHVLLAPHRETEDALPITDDRKVLYLPDRKESGVGPNPDEGAE